MVLLRVAIGWHFLYEGVWKITSGGKFSSTPYLMASVGPLKDTFRGMVDDVDGLRRITKDDLYRRIDERVELIAWHYNKLTPEQVSSLKAFAERKKHGVVDNDTVENLFKDDALFIRQVKYAGEYVDPSAPAKTNQVSEVLVSARPDKRDEIVRKIETMLKQIDDKVRSGCTAEQAQKAGNPPALPAIVPAGAAADDVSWITRANVDKLFDERYEAVRKHYALTDDQHQSATGWRYRDQKKKGHHDKNNVDTIVDDPDFKKAVADYQELLAQIQREEQLEETKYDEERLSYNQKKRDKLRSALLTRAEMPLGDLDLAKIQGFSENLGAIKKVTPEQFAAGPLPANPKVMSFPGKQLTQMGMKLPERTLTYWQDLGMMFGLAAVGACLILGLFTRLAALGGAVMLAMFYLAMPPWPGVPEVGPVEGHYLIVNKNLVELIAVLMIAFSGAGRWLGLDAFLHAMFGRKTKEVVAAPAEAPSQGRVYVPGGRA